MEKKVSEAAPISLWVDLSYICNARKPEKKTCSAFQQGDSRKDTEEPQRKVPAQQIVLRNGQAAHISLKSVPVTASMPVVCLWLHGCQSRGTCRNQPNIWAWPIRHACHKPPAFPPGSFKAVVAKGSSAVYGQLLSPLLADSPPVLWEERN